MSCLSCLKTAAKICRKISTVCPLKYANVPPQCRRAPLLAFGHFGEGASIEMEPVYKRSTYPGRDQVTSAPLPPLYCPHCETSLLQQTSMSSCSGMRSPGGHIWIHKAVGWRSKEDITTTNVRRRDGDSFRSLFWLAASKPLTSIVTWSAAPFYPHESRRFVPFTSIQSDVGPVKHSKCTHGIHSIVHGVLHNKYSIMLARANVL